MIQVISHVDQHIVLHVKPGLLYCQNDSSMVMNAFFCTCVKYHQYKLKCTQTGESQNMLLHFCILSWGLRMRVLGIQRSKTCYSMTYAVLHLCIIMYSTTFPCLHFNSCQVDTAVCLGIELYMLLDNASCIILLCSVQYLL